MFVQFWSFAKRPNSTKQPSPADKTMIMVNDVQLKEATDVLSPTLLISTKLNNMTVSPPLFNYASIPQWERYYHVREWRYMGGIWEVDLTVDVLASFREFIGDTEAYILRSSALYDGDIVDSFYPAKPDVDFRVIPVASSWYGVAPSGGSYVLGIINNEGGNRVGAITYYALKSSTFATVLQWLFGNTISSSVPEISSTLFKAVFNPFQYFVSCIWFPFDISAFGSSQTTIKIGYWDTGVSGTLVAALAEKTYVTATIPDHPQIGRGSYLNRSPYTRLTLYIPPFGSIPIDTNCLSNGHYLYSAVMVDHITGQATIRISTCESENNRSEYNIITERTGMIGVPIQLAQVLTDYMNTGMSLGGGIADLVSGNIFGLLGSIQSAITGAMPKVSTTGANGSFVQFIQNPVLTAEFYLLPEENRTEFGRPLCKTMRISSIPGYIKTGEADHAFPGTQSERDEINQIISNGFFFE